MDNIETEDQWVSFLLGDETFAYRVSEVREIIPYQEPIPVPGSPDNVEGILNVRGEIIPVVSAGKVTGAESNQPERIMILDSTQGLLGMTVDQVGEIIRVDQTEIDFDAGSSESIKGTTLHNENLVILMDLVNQEVEEAF